MDKDKVNAAVASATAAWSTDARRQPRPVKNAADAACWSWPCPAIEPREKRCDAGRWDHRRRVGQALSLRRALGPPPFAPGGLRGRRRLRACPTAESKAPGFSRVSAKRPSSRAACSPSASFCSCRWWPASNRNTRWSILNFPRRSAAADKSPGPVRRTRRAASDADPVHSTCAALGLSARNITCSVSGAAPVFRKGFPATTARSCFAVRKITGTRKPNCFSIRAWMTSQSRAGDVSKTTLPL